MADRSLIEGDEPLPHPEEAPEWGYEEGVEWGLIFPDANGEYQSPINLNSREAKYDPSLLEVRLSPNYVVCRDCEVINDGHSIQIALKSKSGSGKFLNSSVEEVRVTTNDIIACMLKCNSFSSAFPKSSLSLSSND